ncbi:hypothetical protein BJAS_P0337 [Bathymodiolus japonicus methanotrophic gill symbiont]|uniref:hypothetical protein n=1 Tax=Bathymodiolus japonicus methanotrophic gill symbiont TaxID=113269 RepID=UPI001B761815|nr:hypothetical protein [Bathymodiolus japonicus methanotrophic gill symbiont]GFO71100.1 hypothetical protein BJAS_P0337 [Bathymodiolus japonicus methanotrophic gill symbiont]
MATTNGSTAIRDKILASLARYRALRIGKFPCAFWRLSARPGLTATAAKYSPIKFTNRNFNLMAQTQKSSIFFKVLIMSTLIATLLYLFHPGVGQFGVMINGEPVADPLVRFAALPTLFISLIFSVLLIVLVFIGVGMLVFIGAISFVMLGVFFMVPYFWPVLLIILFVILVMSLGNNK